MKKPPDAMIMPGDCLYLLRRFPENYFDACITDPPFGISFQSSRRTESERMDKIANDEQPFIWFLPEIFRVLKDNTPFVCFTRYDVEHDFRRAMEMAGFDVKAQIIWDKVGHGMGDLKGDFAPAHENAIFATKGRYEFPGKRPKSILKHPKVPPEKLEHPNEKPVSLMVELIESLTTEGQSVIDPFCGTGCVSVAAAQLKRQYVGIELNEKYAARARERAESVQGRML